MTGIVEDNDPDAGRGRLFSTVTTSAGNDVPTFDIEALIDRLRFMGLDSDLIDEAEQRLHADEHDGKRWLWTRLKELEPPRKPPTCQCGEPLVDAAWRGRATIRCNVCSARWGVEVASGDRESLWSISGPSAEWRREHPVNEDVAFGEFQPDDVLREGLPPLPTAAIEPGTDFPVATWQGGRCAAVLYVHRQRPEEFDLPGDEYENETEHLVLDDDGQWTSTGGGGGGWVNVFDPPVELLNKYVVLGTGITGTGDGGETIAFTGGLCSPAVAAVEKSDGDGTRTYRIEPDRPFFLVGVHGPGRVRILDDLGRVLRSPAGEPLEFRLND